MNILIINNHSHSLPELVTYIERLFPGTYCDVFDYANLVVGQDTSNYETIILSGGSGVPTAMRHIDEYSVEIELLKSFHGPVLGICLGCQIIVAAHGGTLSPLVHKHNGTRLVNIDPVYQSEFNGTATLSVAESHTLGIESLSNDFTIIARSDDQVPEIIRHTTQPIYGIQFHPELSGNEVFDKWLKTIFIEGVEY